MGGCHMGITAENIASRFNVSREDQDAYAAESQRRADAAIRSGLFRDEIVAVEIPQKKGDPDHVRHRRVSARRNDRGKARRH